MATIPYSTQASFGSKVAIAIGEIREAKAELERVRDAASALASGNFTLIEGGDFGITAGSGQAFFDAINGLCISLNGAQSLAGLNELDKGA